MRLIIIVLLFGSTVAAGYLIGGWLLALISALLSAFCVALFLLPPFISRG